MVSRRPRLVTKPDGRGDYPIHHAARTCDAEIVQLMLQYGADANATNPRGHTVLYCAEGHGHLDTLQLLLSAGADCDATLTRDSKKLLVLLGVSEARVVLPTAICRQVVNAGGMTERSWLLFVGA